MKKTSELIWQDVQHQKLFQIIDSLTEQDGRKALDKLMDYVDYHFSLEEEYMKQLNYPDTKLHVLAHWEFAKIIKNYIKNKPVYDENFARELSEYLSNWLTDHVFGIDKDFEKFVLKSKYK